MLNWIWAAFFLIAFVAAAYQAFVLGRPDALGNVVSALFDSAKTGFEIAIGLTGVMSLWLGLMRVGEKRRWSRESCACSGRCPAARSPASPMGTRPPGRSS